MIHIIWQNILKRKFNTTIGVLVVALCTGSVFTSVLIYTGLQRGIVEGINRTGADIIVLPDKAKANPDEMLFTGSPMNVYMPADKVKEIEAISGVGQTSPQFFTQLLTESCCSAGAAYRLIGFDPANDFLINSWLQDNSNGSLGEAGIVIGGEIPNLIGETIKILGQDFKVMGKIPKTGASIDNTIYMPIDTARELAAGSPYFSYLWEEGYHPSQLISSILIKAENSQDVGKTADSIRKISGVKVYASFALLKEVQQQLKVTKVIFFISFSLLWIACLIIFYNRFAGVIRQRYREIGVMRSLGASKGAIVTILSGEVTIITSFGAICGIVAGYQLNLRGIEFIRANTAYPYLLPDFRDLALYAGLSILLAFMIALIATLKAIRKSAELEPAYAVSVGELD